VQAHPSLIHKRNGRMRPTALIARPPSRAIDKAMDRAIAHARNAILKALIDMRGAEPFEAMLRFSNWHRRATQASHSELEKTFQKNCAPSP
jgi:uncharacterized heparinase superfamily protein